MPTHIAFLRAINLGAKRKFAKDAIVAATESIGGRDVATYINTGNVRLTVPTRTGAKVEELLEAAYAEAAGFEIAVMVRSPAELTQIASDARDIAPLMPELGMHYVSLLKNPPAPAAITAVESTEADGEMALVRGREAHLLVRQRDNYHQAKLSGSWIEKHLGPATNRNLTVINTLADKWGA